MALIPVAGSHIDIGGVLQDKIPDFVEADFASQVWVEIDGWESAGAVGDNANLITSQLINRGRDIKQKGTKNAGSMQNSFAVVANDPGQVAVQAAVNSIENFAFRIRWSDGSQRLFIGVVMGAPEQGGNANTISMIETVIEINSNIVRIAAP